MGKRTLPELPDTGRRYRDDTMRARLASPGIERYRSERRARSGALFLAALLLAALVAAFVWLGGR